MVGAVDRYGDIAPEPRARLKARMAKRDYDDLGSTALAMDEWPSFVAPGDIRAPLSADGPVGAHVATSEEGAGTTSLPPGGPFAPGYYATLQIGSAGAVLSPAAPATQTLPPSAPPTGGTGRAVPPPRGITPFLITPVPEPQTWALMLSGLAVLTWLRRRARASMARMKDAWTAGSWFEGQLVVERHG